VRVQRCSVNCVNSVTRLLCDDDGADSALCSVTDFSDGGGGGSSNCSSAEPFSPTNRKLVMKCDCAFRNLGSLPP
jgi:hypothetical protein